MFQSLHTSSSVAKNIIKTVNILSLHVYQMSTRLKNELPQMANSYVYNYTPSFNSLKNIKFYKN